MSEPLTQLGVVCDPEIMGGEPVIAGTRVPVELVLGELSFGHTTAEILYSYPSLPPNAIEIATRYAESLEREHPLAQLLWKYRAICR